jgi:hypothetical protein
MEADWAFCERYMHLFARPARMTEQMPAFAWDPSKGRVTYPVKEKFVFDGERNEWLSVVLDYSGQVSPEFTYYSPDPVPAPDPVEELGKIVKRLLDVVELQQVKIEAAELAAKVANDRLDRIAESAGRPPLSVGTKGKGNEPKSV